MQPEATIELRPANECDAPCLESLLDAYLRELDEGRRSDGSADSIRRYRYLDLYWSDADRHAFLIDVEGEAVGFALVRDVAGHESVVHRVAEFYVTPAKRGRGIGQSAAFAVWARFPGRWELQVETGNSAAVRFWSSCIEAATHAVPRVSEARLDDTDRLCFEFIV